MWKFLKDFCDHTTIHGVRYFVEPRRHWTERIWWIVAFILSIWMFTHSMQNYLDTWQKYPASISFTEPKLSVSKIPFPMVTFCSEVKVSVEKLNLSVAMTSLNNLTDTEQNQIKTLAHICRDVEKKIDFDDNITTDAIYDLIMDMAPPYAQTVVSCKAHDAKIPCQTYIVPVLTNDGLCFAFNVLNSDDVYTEHMAPPMKIVNSNQNVTNWNIENGYKQREANSSYVAGGGFLEFPLRNFNPSGHLRVYLATHTDNIQSKCRGMIHGYKVMINVPGEVVHTGKYEMQAPFYANNRILMQPRIYTTSKQLRKYTPNRRGCYFNDERQLRFLKIYTLQNCEYECLANFTKEICGCVNFGMPRDRNTKICGSSNIECYESAKWAFYDEHSSSEHAIAFRKECNCLPGCVSIDYRLEFDSTEPDYSRKEGREITKVIVGYRDHKVTNLKRIELYTFTDFLAACGGLLGLFLGISVLSIVEIIYYFTLRIFWRFREYRSQNSVKPFQKKSVNTGSIDMPKIAFIP